GDTYYQLNDPAKAMEYWKKALELEPNNDQIRSKVERGSP
ncbi:MAG: tetratricopeptide repeat protein, partial [Ignavibacterium sp.]